MEAAKFAERIDALVAQRKFDQAIAEAKELGRDDVVEKLKGLEAKADGRSAMDMGVGLAPEELVKPKAKEEPKPEPI
jgi:hypothetical protein